jgi:hypothetical protein
MKKLSEYDPSSIDFSKLTWSNPKLLGIGCSPIGHWFNSGCALHKARTGLEEVVLEMAWRAILSRFGRGELKFEHIL